MTDKNKIEDTGQYSSSVEPFLTTDPKIHTFDSNTKLLN